MFQALLLFTGRCFGSGALAWKLRLILKALLITETASKFSLEGSLDSHAPVSAVLSLAGVALEECGFSLKVKADPASINS